MRRNDLIAHGIAVNSLRQLRRLKKGRALEKEIAVRDRLKHLGPPGDDEDDGEEGDQEAKQRGKNQRAEEEEDEDEEAAAAAAGDEDGGLQQFAVLVPTAADDNVIKDKIMKIDEEFMIRTQDSSGVLRDPRSCRRVHLQQKAQV